MLQVPPEELEGDACIEALRFMVQVGYCPHPVTVYVRGPINGYI